MLIQDKRVGPDNLNWKKSEVNITLDRLSHSLERSVELNEGIYRTISSTSLGFENHYIATWFVTIAA